MSDASNIDVSTRDIIFSDRVSGSTERTVVRGLSAAIFAFAAAAATLALLVAFGS